jgi:hypothetical protein
MTGLEVWGGVECTVDRVGHRYFEQLERSGHAMRLHDLEQFAALGIKALRFPTLSERLAPQVYRCIRKAGIRDEQLDQFLEAPCAPDILGINHYITSNGFLDERLERYPVCSHGGNEREHYADLEAVRIGAASLVSPLCCAQRSVGTI